MNKKKTLICVNVLDSVKSAVYGSHCQEWFRLGRDTIDDFILFHPERTSIDNSRNQAAKYAMELQCDYLWFVDDDMVLSPRTYISLRNCEADVVMAHTYIRGIPFDPMFFKNTGTNGHINLEYYRDWESNIENDGTIKCDAVGFACTLINVNNLYKMEAPYFITGTQFTEDIYFCIKLRARFSNAIILVDYKVPTGHLLSPEIITASNRDRLLTYYNEEMELRTKIASDRGKEYFERCKQVF